MKHNIGLFSASGECAVLFLLGFLSHIGLATAAPSNDDFDSAIPIEGETLSFSGSNVGATVEDDEPFHAGEFGGASVWFLWTAPRDGECHLSTVGSFFDTILAVYTGSALRNLEFMESNDDFGGDTTSQLQFSAEAGVTYAIAVEGFDGETGTFWLSLRLDLPLPAPVNDLFANRLEVTGERITAAGTNVGARKEPGEPDHDQLRGGRSVWWSWTAPFTVRVNISTEGSDFDTILAIYTGSSVDALRPVASNDDYTDATSLVSFKAVAGTTYQIAVDGFARDSGNVLLSIARYEPRPAPEWTLRDVAGNLVRSSDFAGKVVMLNFWATWCIPCIQEIPALIAFQQQYSSEGLEIIGVSTDREGASVVAPFVTEHRMNYTVLLNTAQFERDFGGIEFIPTTFVIDRQNMIVSRYVGIVSLEFFEAEVLPLLRPPIELKIERAGNEFAISWPATARSFLLFYAEKLPAEGWFREFTPAERTGDRWTVKVSAQSTRFYKLVSFEP
ncbi:MAG: redoxin domain-containing protein [Verrucomicrobiota bacterium]